MKHDCPHQICRICNALDSHPSYKCPTRQTCLNCSQTGHRTSECPFQRNLDPSRPCSMCGDYGHFDANCHQIWRYYRPVDPSKMKMKSLIRRYCYNCAEEGHLGDDCGYVRPYYILGGRPGVLVSAFGEGNVPEWAKTIPEVTRRRREPMIPKRKTHERGDEYRRLEDEDDGWFARGERDPPPPPSPPSLAKRIGGIKMPKNIRREAIANAAESRRPTLDRPPLPNEPIPRDPPPQNRDFRDRSPLRSDGRGSHVSSSSVDSYRPRYPPRQDSRKRDWEEEQGQWRRRRDEERAERDYYRPRR